MGAEIGVFSGLAIIVACLGLLGLVTLATQQRQREVAIRKVLGSSVGAIILLISKDFIKWVVIANVIAWPVAYLIIREWLSNFAYHTSLTIDIFLLASALALVIAFVTVAYQAVRAAKANPVDALKYE